LSLIMQQPMLHETCHHSSMAAEIWNSTKRVLLGAYATTWLAGPI